MNTLKCLKEKWQPHFELKRWVWPMIKCSHLTPKSIYSNIGDLVADPSRCSSLVFSSICSLLARVFLFQKKLHLDVSLLLFCVSFLLASFAANSLQIFVRIPLPSELSWQKVPLHQTRFHRSDTTRSHRLCCPKEFSVKYSLSFFLLQLHSMILILYLYLELLKG